MKPLSKKTRYSSLGILFLIFIILGPALILYSEGYRLSDIENVLKVVKTGGVFVHSENITNTQVYLNGEFVKNSGVLLRNTFIQDLRPDEKYKIEVYKDGYHGYVKYVDVYPSLVTEVTVLMLPKEISEREILKYFDKDGVATSTSPFVVGTKTPMFEQNSEYKEMLVLFDMASSTSQIANLQKNIKENINTRLNTSTTTATSTKAKKDIPEYFEKLGIEDPDLLKNLIQVGDEISWLEKGDIVLSWVGKTENSPYYFCSRSNECREKIVLNWSSDISRFDYLPGRFNAWIVLVPDGIWAVEIDDRSERNIQPIYSGKNLDFRIASNGKIVVKEADRFIELSI